MSLAWRELDGAIRALAGPGTQRQRLLGACRHVLPLRRKELPAEIRADYDLLCAVLGGDPAALSGAVEAAGDEAVAAATDAIIRMHDAVTRYQPIPKPARA